MENSELNNLRQGQTIYCLDSAAFELGLLEPVKYFSHTTTIENEITFVRYKNSVGEAVILSTHVFANELEAYYELRTRVFKAYVTILKQEHKVKCKTTVQEVLESEGKTSGANP